MGRTFNRTSKSENWLNKYAGSNQRIIQFIESKPCGSYPLPRRFYTTCTSINCRPDNLNNSVQVSLIISSKSNLLGSDKKFKKLLDQKPHAFNKLYNLILCFAQILTFKLPCRVPNDFLRNL